VSTACQKQFTITVNSAIPTVDAYWTLDEAVGDKIDKVQSVHIFDVDNDGVPALFNNGLARNTPHNANIQTNSDARIKFAGTGFSVFGWFKINATQGDGSTGPRLWYNIGAGRQIRMEYGNTFVSGNMHFDYNDSNGLFNDLYFTVTLHAWHFLHMFYDHTVQKVGWSIDNGTETLDGTGIFFSNTNPFGDLGSDGPANFTFDTTLDETGLKLSRKLTAGEVAYLYNNGAGRTWPLT
jgi:hypothetical protein